MQHIIAASLINGKKTPGSAECSQYLPIAMETVSKAGTHTWAGCRGLGQTVMEIILTLHAPFLDNMCKIFGRWGMPLRTRLWMFQPTLLAGSLGKYGGFRNLGLPSNWLDDTGGHLASPALSFSYCKMRGVSSWKFLQALPAWLQAWFQLISWVV